MAVTPPSCPALGPHTSPWSQEGPGLLETPSRFEESLFTHRLTSHASLLIGGGQSRDHYSKRESTQYVDDDDGKPPALNSESLAAVFRFVLSRLFSCGKHTYFGHCRNGPYNLRISYLETSQRFTVWAQRPNPPTIDTALSGTLYPGKLDFWI